MSRRANDDPRWVCDICGGPVTEFDTANAKSGIVAWPCGHVHRRGQALRFVGGLDER